MPVRANYFRTANETAKHKDRDDGLLQDRTFSVKCVAGVMRKGGQVYLPTST